MVSVVVEDLRGSDHFGVCRRKQNSGIYRTEPHEEGSCDGGQQIHTNRKVHTRGYSQFRPVLETAFI